MVDSEPNQFIRKHPRRNLVSNAMIFYNDVAFHAKTAQISEGGMLIGCDSLFDIGTTLIVHFVIGDQYIRLKAEVIYHVNSDSADKLAYFGIKFIEVTKEKLKIISDYTRN